MSDGRGRNVGGYTFENPTNGHREHVGSAASWGMFFLGFIYMAYKGLWNHLFIMAFVAALSFRMLDDAGFLVLGAVWLLYTAWAQRLVINSYLVRGWRLVSHDDSDEDREDVGEATIADELSRLIAMRNAGDLTEEEFRQGKARVLS